MKIICLFTLFLFPVFAAADWALRQTEEGHWIRNSTPEGHELIVVHNDSRQTHFLLVLAVGSPVPEAPAKISMTIDRGPVIQAPLKLLEQRRKTRLYSIEIDDDSKAIYIARMIAGLKLRIWFGDTTTGKQALSFSLTGFTAAFNDLLLAGELGRLDPEWLVEHGRQKELGCFYTANLYVAAMRERMNGQSRADTTENLPRTGYKAVDDMIPNIVSQVYAMSTRQLPIDPRADKFAIYKRCMGEVSP